MADVVRANMERMVPELEDLVEKNILSKVEVRSVIKRRRAFEYRLKNRAVDKMDYLNYISYEMNFETLRRERKKRLGIKKASASDYAGMRRIHSIFTRALKKFKFDIRLWLQYADFCARTGSKKVLGRLFPKALQLLPREVGLWIHAASYEIACYNNYDSARKILQRGLRINESSQQLWLEYFRMELLYLQKIAMRRQVLGLEDETKNLEADGGADSAMDAIMEGAIPKVVFRQAVQAIPENFAFVAKFLALCDQLPVRAAGSIAEAIEQHNEQVFGGTEAWWQAHAARAYRRREDRAAGIAVFETAVARLPTPAMFEHYAAFLCATAGARAAPALAMVASVCERAVEVGPLTGALQDMWCGALMRLGDFAAVAKALDVCIQSTPRRCRTWTLRLDLAMRQHALAAEGAADGVEVSALFDAAFRAVEPSKSLPLHQRWVDWGMGTQCEVVAMQRRFLNALRALPGQPDLCSQYVSWAALNHTNAADDGLLNTAVNVVLKSPFGRPNDPDLFLLCIRAYPETTQQQQQQRKRTQALFEQALSSSTIRSASRMWLSYLSFLRAVGNLAQADRVYWRASEVLGEAQKIRLDAGYMALKE